MTVFSPLRAMESVLPAPSVVPSDGMSYLLEVVQELSLAHDLDSVQRIVRQAARRLTGCDGASFILRDGDRCFYADEDAIGPLWKGMHFPLESCISGWAMQNRQPAVIADIYADPRIPHEAYRPTFVKSLVMVPIRTHAPIGAIGNYWAHRREPEPEEVKLLQALADCTSIAMENVQLCQNFEHRVQERTRELQSAYDEIHHLWLTDELTGLNNRRGFRLLAEQALRHAARYRIDCALMFLDVDGLKCVNDELGHEAGDSLIRLAAQALRQTFRDCDILARVGGDEFCVLVLGLQAGDALDQRLQSTIATLNAEPENEGRRPWRLSASTGVVRHPVGAGTSLDELVAKADALMYERKKASKNKSKSARV